MSKTLFYIRLGNKSYYPNNIFRVIYATLAYMFTARIQIPVAYGLMSLSSSAEVPFKLKFIIIYGFCQGRI